MLADGEDLDVRVAHELHVGRQLVGQLAVAEPAIVVVGDAHPRAEVDFVDGDRRIVGMSPAAPRQPFVVLPAVTAQVPHSRRGIGAHFGGKRVGVGLDDPVALVVRLEGELVESALSDAGDEALPDAGRALLVKEERAGLPAVEVADNRYFAGVRGPDREVGAGQSVLLGEMRSELFVGAVVRPLGPKMEVELRQEGRASRTDRSHRAVLSSVDARGDWCGYSRKNAAEVQRLRRIIHRGERKERRDKPKTGEGDGRHVT